MIHTGIDRIGLGTVQFGLDYGVSNTEGQTTLEEVGRILNFADSKGIKYLDTSPSYGQSEKSLGALARNNNSFKIVTKTGKTASGAIDQSVIVSLEREFQLSLARLSRESVYGLLVHSSKAIHQIGASSLFDWLTGLKEKGLVQKIGVSVYDEKDIRKLLRHVQVDIIQLPINLFDQRLLQSGAIHKLKQAGIEIHARSIFLQGLLLMDLSNLPSYFDPFKIHLAKFTRFLERHSLTPLEACLGFALSLDEIDVILCGVNNLKQLQEVARIATKTYDSSIFAELGNNDPALLNPALWKID